MDDEDEMLKIEQELLECVEEARIIQDEIDNQDESELDLSE